MAAGDSCAGIPSDPPRNLLELGLRFQPLLPLKWALSVQQFCQLGNHIREAESGPNDCIGEHLPAQPQGLPQHLYQGRHGGCC